MIGALALAGPPVQGGPDSPLGDLLGYVVLFVVVVWPIIRGVLDQAQGRRTEFEQQQRRKRPPGKRADGGRSLEEILRGDPYVEALEEPLLEDVVREVEAASPPPLPPERLSKSSLGERSADAVRPTERELVGDPFDDSIMGMDLVDDLSLADVPAEDELEVSLDHGPRRPIRGAVAQSASAPTVSAAERGLGGLERRFTPWQRAFVLKEILGPPAATRTFDDGRL
ncbi:MAG: hypothetical protein VX015_06015 [Planctomycetota bacterium]|nr:hypothetical protein [Planctomycetota bacterium]